MYVYLPRLNKSNNTINVIYPVCEYTFRRRSASVCVSVVGENEKFWFLFFSSHLVSLSYLM